MKILVVGYPRSGTTLLRRIFQRHPNVSTMLHERYILDGRSREDLQQLPFFNSEHWGEKDIYTQKNCYNIHTKRLLNITILDYCNLWIKTFGLDQSKIIHIVRHPFDVLDSLIKKAARRYKRNLTKREKYNIISLYMSVVPNYTKAISDLPNCMTIKYEKLVLDKGKVTKNLFRFCGLPETNDPERAKIERVLAYKRKKFNFDVEDTIKIMNDFGKPKYNSQ